MIAPVPRPFAAGVGLSTNPRSAAEVLQWKLEGRRPFDALGYLQIGVYSHEELPPELPERLAASGTPCVVHLLEIDLVRPLAPQADRLRRLVEIVDRLQPVCVEEDLGLWRWGVTELEQHMLPPILDREVADRVARAAREVRDAFGRPFLVENPPVYFELGEMDLLAFLERVGERSGCGLVLDIGHLVGYCAATGREPEEYLAAWPGMGLVRELHLSGFVLTPDPAGPPMWFDDHASPISDYGLSLVSVARELAGVALPVTLEQEGATYARIGGHIRAVTDHLRAEAQ